MAAPRQSMSIPVRLYQMPAVYQTKAENKKKGGFAKTSINISYGMVEFESKVDRPVVRPVPPITVKFLHTYHYSINMPLF